MGRVEEEKAKRRHTQHRRQASESVSVVRSVNFGFESGLDSDGKHAPAMFSAAIGRQSNGLVEVVVVRAINE